MLSTFPCPRSSDNNVLLCGFPCVEEETPPKKPPTPPLPGQKKQDLGASRAERPEPLLTQGLDHTHDFPGNSGRVTSAHTQASVVQAGSAADCSPLTSNRTSGWASAPSGCWEVTPDPSKWTPCLPRAPPRPGPRPTVYPRWPGCGAPQALGHTERATALGGPAGRHSCTQRAGAVWTRGDWARRGRRAACGRSSGSQCQGPVAGRLLGWERQVGTCPDGGSSGPQEGPGGREHGLGEGLGARFHTRPQPLWSIHAATWAAPRPQASWWEVVRWRSEPCFLAAPHRVPRLREPLLGGGLRAGPLPCPGDPAPTCQPALSLQSEEPWGSPLPGPCHPQNKAALSTTRLQGQPQVPGQEAPPTCATHP